MMLAESMREPKLDVRQTEGKGRGVFSLERVAKGRRILEFQGRILKSSELTDDLLAMQVGPDLWLCSDGSLLDDCVNHSCDPNAGFLDGEPTLYAIRDISPDEEIGWDYSTSIAEPGWMLDCRCGSVNCRGVVQAWGELTSADRDRLRPISLRFVREL